MRSTKIVALVALLAGSVAFGASQVVYTLEVGGNNNADLWEANQAPTFVKGITSGTLAGTIPNGDSVTWAVRVTVGGYHSGGGTGIDGKVPYGAANLVFDVELYDNAGNLVSVGAAPLALNGSQNEPTAAGFWSSINDGDAAGVRGGISPDIEANAAFAIDIQNQDPESAQKYTLIDPAPNGPGFDYGWYPTANGRGGVDIDGSKPINYSINDPALAGKLVGFGAGMKSYDYTNYRPGVGKLYINDSDPDLGFGAYIDDITPGQNDPLNPPAGVDEKVLFEGQICTKGLPAGTYTLKVKPSADGTNVIHNAVQWKVMTPDYGGFGSFAVKANEVYPTDANNPGVKFVVGAPVVNTTIAARKIFYNQSYYDTNNAAIQPPAAGARDDDNDAVDPTKSPLLPGGGMAVFANWIVVEKGINGLIYEFNNATRDPVAGDFAFDNIGRLGTAAPVAQVPSAFAVFDMGGGVKRVVVTFANASIKNTWLQVTIGTGFGLPAADVHYWGHALGDSGTGNTVPNIQVTSTDEVAARNNRVVLPARATVDNRYDYNKDGNVTATDEVLCRNNIIPVPTNSVRMITR